MSHTLVNQKEPHLKIIMNKFSKAKYQDPFRMMTLLFNIIYFIATSWKFLEATPAGRDIHNK